MLPAGFSTSASLADVLTSCLATVTGAHGAIDLPEVSRTVVVVVDGLGSHALRARSGHARFLAPRLTRATTITSGSPTTTAAAITTLCTGHMPGEHGIIGYRARDPRTGRVFNHLSGWNGDPDPATWQRCETVFERATAQGVVAYAIGPERYSSSSFTAASLRGAEYVGANSMQHRVELVRDLFDRGGRQVVYLYVPELDVIAHAQGSESDAWLVALEQLDSVMSTLARSLRAGEGAFVTADHGILDVPQGSHVLFDAVPELTVGVQQVGGEPRMLQLYLDRAATDDDREMLAASWREAEGNRAWVATRSEAIEAGWFGPTMDAEVAPRIGDVLVAARARIAYYDSSPEGIRSRTMVGQHGSFSSEEQKVPLIRLGAFE
ncbi:MAG TPA: alkaline phosphatase family protein [Humibacter sp.]|nr:alkaline phosphatase family protein [Humibacter sp.]